MISFKNVVLTTDLSENSQAAAPYAGALARQHQGRLHLLHVFEDPWRYGAVPDTYGVYDYSAWSAQALEARQKQLAELARYLAELEKVEVVSAVREGHTVEEILRYAKDAGADCLVLATHGRTGLARLFYGSVAERVVRFSPCPVMSVRPKEIREGKSVPPREAKK